VLTLLKTDITLELRRKSVWACCVSAPEPDNTPGLERPFLDHHSFSVVNAAAKKYEVVCSLNKGERNKISNQLLLKKHLKRYKT
jgi:hypothetical protein